MTGKYPPSGGWEPVILPKRDKGAQESGSKPVPPKAPEKASSSK